MTYLEKQLKEIEDQGAYNVDGRKEKFAKQLIEQGFHDGHTFDLWTHLVDLILPRLIRYKELASKKQSVDKTKLSTEIIARDKYDSEREISPLRCAEDAFYLDTSKMDKLEVVSKILDICRVN